MLKLHLVFLSVHCFQARQTAQQKKQAAEESRKDYVTSLNQFNQDQHQHYHTLVPVIYQVNQHYHTGPSYIPGKPALPHTGPSYMSGKVRISVSGLVFAAYPGHGGAADRENL